MSQIQPIYDQLFELLKPIKATRVKSIHISLTLNGEDRIIGQTIHVYDGESSGISDTFESALAQLADSKVKIKRDLEAARSEVARLEKKLMEQQ